MFCGECGGSFAVQDLARFGNSYVCPNCKPAYVQRMREGGQPFGATMTGVRYGGFWIRVLAVFIDGLIMGVVITPLFLIVGFGAGMFHAVDAENPPNIAAILLFELFALALVMVYQVWFLTKKGATPGKMAVGIKVVMADGQGLTVGRAIGRYFAYLLSGFTLYIGYIIAAFDSQKRALHDHICNTRVIYSR
jgi:uncharacterized RDD family membrane protein YckC